MSNIAATAAFAFAFLASLASGAEAVDGVQLINQELAMAGSVTPGDEPGFPVTITRSGSYRLSGNLRLNVPNVNVIEITAANVTLDLNGFTIQGPRDQCFRRTVPTWCTMDTVSGQGVSARFEGGAGPSNITVFNGTIRAMVYTGVWLIGSRNVRIDRLTVTQNGGDGIVIYEGALVSNSIVSHNNGFGIAGMFIPPDGGTAVAVGNVVQFNRRAGLSSLVIRDNVLWGNRPTGPPQVSAVIDAGGNICDNASC